MTVIMGQKQFTWIVVITTDPPPNIVLGTAVDSQVDAKWTSRYLRTEMCYLFQTRGEAERWLKIRGPGFIAEIVSETVIPAAELQSIRAA